MILQPPATLLQGAPGTGKTDVLATLIEAGLELFVIMTEPDGAASLLDSIARRKLDVEKLHYQEVLPVAAGWAAMEDMAKTIAAKGYEDIQKIKDGVGKDVTRRPAMALLSAMKDFRCDRTGKNYGDVASWDHSRAFAFDSLSGLSLMSWMLTLGYKPSAHQGEWGVAMNFVEQIVLKMTSDRRCFFVLTSHVEKEPDTLSGTQKTMVSTLGQKLAPKIPRFFSDHVWAKKTAGAGGTPDFFWSTLDTNADLKSRNLPASPKLPASFVPIVEAYRRRMHVAAAQPHTAVTSAAPAATSALTPQAEPMTRAAQTGAQQ